MTDHGAGADDCARTDADAGKHDRTGADERQAPDPHAPAERRVRGDVGKVPDRTVVVDDCAMVNDCTCSDRTLRCEHRMRSDEGPRLNVRGWRDRRKGVDHRHRAKPCRLEFRGLSGAVGVSTDRNMERTDTTWGDRRAPNSDAEKRLPNCVGRVVDHRDRKWSARENRLDHHLGVAAGTDDDYGIFSMHCTCE